MIDRIIAYIKDIGGNAIDIDMRNIQFDRHGAVTIMFINGKLMVHQSETLADAEEYSLTIARVAIKMNRNSVSFRQEDSDEPPPSWKAP